MAIFIIFDVTLYYLTIKSFYEKPHLPVFCHRIIYNEWL